MVSLRTNNQKVREFMAEFLGTLTLIFLGCSANVAIKMNSLSQPDNNIGAVAGPISWSLALTAAIYLAGGVSGGHYNPALTLGLVTVGKVHWDKLIHYFVAQYLGAFIGSSFMYIIHRESLENFNQNQTFDVFATVMRNDIQSGTAFLDQLLSTAFFVAIICAITDERNMQIPKGLIPIAVGFVNLGAMQFSFATNCGAPLNPARDLGPRIFAQFSGWSEEAFSKQTKYFWIPVIACHFGGIIGCWMYRLMIENHWPETTSYDLRHDLNSGGDETVMLSEIPNRKNSNQGNTNSNGESSTNPIVVPIRVTEVTE